VFIVEDNQNENTEEFLRSTSDVNMKNNNDVIMERP